MKLYFNPCLERNTGIFLLFSLPGETLSMKLITSICPIKLQLLSQLCKRTWYNHFASTKKKKKRKIWINPKLFNELFNSTNFYYSPSKYLVYFDRFEIIDSPVSEQRKLSFGFGNRKSFAAINLIINDTTRW